MKDEKMSDGIFLNYERAKVFFEKNLIVHIVKKSGAFYNGLITEIATGKDFFFINDKVEGKKLIFFSELKKEIEEFKHDN